MANNGYNRGSTLKSAQKLSNEAFRADARRLLSGVERNNLLIAVRRYQHDKSARRLVAALIICLNTTEKLSLLRHVRRLIPGEHLAEFDLELSKCVSIRPAQNGVNRRQKRVVNNRIERNDERAGHRKSFRIVNLRRKTNGENLGYTLSGGNESNIGIFISKVVRHSASERAGLRVDDELIEVNGISLKFIALSSAVKLLSSLNKLKLVVSCADINGNQHEKPKQDVAPRVLITEHDVSETNNSHSIVEPESEPPAENQTLIEDIRKARTFSGSASDELLVPPPSMIQLRRNSSILNGNNSDDERRINLIVESTPNGFIGFSIRGGAEYGLGIYVSRVDPGSTAEECGLQAGDQILDANGIGFENIQHNDAVKYIKSHEHIILTVKAVGKIPESKCYVAEYSWLAPDGSRLEATSDRLSRSLPSSALRKLSGETDHADESTETPLNQTSISLPSASVAIQTGDAVEELDDLSDFIGVRSNENIFEDNTNGTNGAFHLQLPMEEKIDVELSMLRSSSRLDNSENDVTFGNQSPQLSLRAHDWKKTDLGARNSITSINSLEDFETLWHVDDKSTQRLSKQKSFLQRQSNKIRSKFNFKKKPKTEISNNTVQENLFDKTGNVQLWIKYVDGEAKKLLDGENYRQLMDQLYDYLEKGDVELFTRNCIEVLDTPDKWVLLKAIRTIVFPYDISRFDSRISRYEIEHMSEGDAQEIDHQLLDSPLSDKPPKRTLITAVQGKSGKFQLRSTEEAEILEREKEEKAKIASRKYFHAKTILDRDKSIQRYNSFTNIPQPSPYFGRSLIAKSHTDLDETPVRDHWEERSTLSPYAAVNDERLYATVNHDDEIVYATVNRDEERPAEDGYMSVESPSRFSLQSQEYDDIQLKVPSITETSEPFSPTALQGSYVELEQIGAGGYSNGNHDDELIDSDNGNVVRLTAEKEDDAYESLDDVKQTEKRTLMIPKSKATLGISISGGISSVAQPEIRIEHVYPGGAASEVEGIKAGLHLLAIDDHSLVGATHSDAVDWIRQSFKDKDDPYMVLEVDNK